MSNLCYRKEKAEEVLYVSGSEKKINKLPNKCLMETGKCWRIEGEPLHVDRTLFERQTAEDDNMKSNVRVDDSNIWCAIKISNEVSNVFNLPKSSSGMGKQIYQSA